MQQTLKEELRRKVEREREKSASLAAERHMAKTKARAAGASATETSGADGSKRGGARTCTFRSLYLFQNHSPLGISFNIHLKNLCLPALRQRESRFETAPVLPAISHGGILSGDEDAGADPHSTWSLT